MAAMLFAAITTAEAKKCEYNADLEIKIWDNNSAPHSNGITSEEVIPLAGRVENVSEAVLYIYKAAKDVNTSKAVVICPGGGYGRLAIAHEGEVFGKWLAKNGITAAVLKYRMPMGVKEIPLEDAVEALRIMRKEAKKLGFDPEKVGFAGFSAGGHLAASISTLAEKEDRPNFSLLFYPVISSKEHNIHRGSFVNLLGEEATESVFAEYSLEDQVDEDTPPAILIHCNDDTLVPSTNSIAYYEALKEFNRHSALYIFPKGGHGWGMNDDIQYKAIWQTLLLDWIGKLDK